MKERSGQVVRDQSLRCTSAPPINKSHGRLQPIDSVISPAPVTERRLGAQKFLERRRNLSVTQDPLDRDFWEPKGFGKPMG